MLKILVVDDYFPYDILRDIASAHSVSISLARSEREARGNFLPPGNVDFQLILMDGYLGKDFQRPPDTLDLVRYIRLLGYQGPIISISSDPAAQELLQGAGCTDSWSKSHIVPLLKQWIQDHRN